MLGLASVDVTGDAATAPAATGQERAFKLLLGEVTLRDETPIEVIDGEQAVVDAEWVAGRHRTSAAAVSRLAQAYLVAGMPDDARRAAVQAGHLAIEGRDVPAIIATANTLIATGDWARLEELLTIVSDVAPARIYWAACSLQRGDWPQAMARLGTLDDFDSYKMAAWIALQQNDFRNAIHNFRAALRHGDPSPDLLIDLGYAYARLGARRKAVRTTAAASRLAPFDLRAGFNLVAFRTSVRDIEGAFRELSRMSLLAPNDLRIPMTEAALWKQLGEGDRGRRELQIIMASQRFWGADSQQQEEFRALESMMAYDSRRLSRDDLVSRLERAVERTDARSLFIAQGLASAYSLAYSDTPKLRSLIERLAKFHAREELYGPLCRLATAERDYERAATMAYEWLAHEPFNALAAAQTTYLLIGLARYDEATEVGCSYLELVDDRDNVLNNTAYAFAMVGNLIRARQLLGRVNVRSPQLLATQALVDIRSGRIEEGQRGYLEAAEFAQTMGDESLALLIKFKLSQVLAAMGMADGAEKVELPEAVAEDPRYELIVLEAGLAAGRGSSRGTPMPSC